MSKIILFNKPYGVISQFRDHEKHPTLAKFIHDPTLRVAGRLDTDSEGLMLLTDNGKLNAALTDPKHKKFKTYYAQVEGTPSDEQLNMLRKGVNLKDGMTRPARIKRIEAPSLWERNPPVRFRKTVPTHWLSIGISEGKNRQVRRMTAAVGLPTLRLVRMQIDQFCLTDLQPSESKSLSLTPDEMSALLPTPPIQSDNRTPHRKENAVHRGGHTDNTKKTPIKKFGKPVRKKQR